MRVLVVEDDDDDIRFLLRSWLEDESRCGQVAEATSPGEAVDLARAQQFDAVVLDYMLSGGSALDCVSELRLVLPQARIIVYTANRAVGPTTEAFRDK